MAGLLAHGRTPCRQRLSFCSARAPACLQNELLGEPSTHGGATDANIAPMAAAAAAPFTTGQSVLYAQRDGTHCLATVIAVLPGSVDDPELSYTVAMPSGMQRDTIAARLTASSSDALEAQVSALLTRVSVLHIADGDEDDEQQERRVLELTAVSAELEEAQVQLVLAVSQQQPQQLPQPPQQLRQPQPQPQPQPQLNILMERLQSGSAGSQLRAVSWADAQEALTAVDNDVARAISHLLRNWAAVSERTRGRASEPQQLPPQPQPQPQLTSFIGRLGAHLFGTTVEESDESSSAVGASAASASGQNAELPFGTEWCNFCGGTGRGARDKRGAARDGA